MKRNALAFLGVKPEEQGQVWLMLATGFFIGIFIATYQVTAESLFLNKLSHQLDYAFLISGVLGIVSTVLFTFFQNRLKFVTLTIFTIAIVILATFSLYYFYHVEDEGTQNITLFIMYCLIGPFTAILLLCYWGIFGRLFNFKQSKRIIGWIDTGQLIAIILANFLIPATSRFFPDTSNYLIVCNVSIVGSLTCLILIAVKYSLAKINTDASVRRETSFGKILGNPYTRLLSVFLIVSMVTISFSQYTFQTLLNKQYPNQRDLTDFLAYFNGTIYALSLLMQLFVNERILGTYGIRISLFVLPIVLAILSLGSVLSGFFLGYDALVNPQTYIYFFLFVAVTRLFNTMLRDSLENPVYKLLFIPLDNRVRFSIQTKIEGVVNESGRFLAGLFIFLFALIPFFKIVWIPIIVLGLILAYYKVIQNLYQEYKEKIKAKLEHTEDGLDRLEVGYKQIANRLESNLQMEDSSKAVFSFKLLEKIEPGKVSLWVNTLMKNSQEATKDFAQRKMNEIKGLSVSENYVIRIDKDKQSDDKNILTRNELDLILTSGGDIQKARIQKLARSTDIKDRHYCAELLLHSQNRENISYLIELLNDTNHKVRSAAIKTAVKRNDNEVVAALIENLAQAEYANEAMNALTLVGDPAIPLLDNAFYRPGQNSSTMLRLVQIIGVIGGNRAKEVLWNKIDYPDKVIVSQVLLALGESGFKAGMAQISRIKYAIESDIGAIAWNLGALTEVGDNQESNVVRKALNREIQNDIEHIFMLLAMLYDTRSIQLVKENLDSGTSEGIAYAIELLDVFLSEQLKMRVLPVLDDLSTSEKIKRLEIFYPRVQLDEKLVLKFLINRDFTQSNRWTKAAVLHQIGIQKISDFNMDLIAQIFNPDKLIRETAAWALNQIDPALYTTHVARLGPDVKRELDKSVLGTKGANLMLFDKVLFFQQTDLFEEVPGITLSYLADVTKTLSLDEGKTLIVDESQNPDFYIVFQGEVEYYDHNKKVITYQSGQFVGERLSSSGYINSHALKAGKASVLLKVNKDQFYELLAEHVHMADKFLEYI